MIPGVNSLKKEAVGEKDDSFLLSVLQPASEITPRKVEWMWNPMLARRKFHLLAARGGSAKTSIACDLAARITTGGSFPGGASFSTGFFEKGAVLFITTEDDPEDTLLPRFLAAGGDSSNLTFLSSSEYHLDLNDRPDELGKILKSMPDLSLVILDPVTAMTGGADTHVDSNVKRLAGILSGLSIEHDLSILGIMHFRKGTPMSKGSGLVDMVTGSAGWVNSARIALACFVDEKTDIGYFGVIKSNIGHKKYTLGYSVQIDDDVVKIEYLEAQQKNIEIILLEVAARESKESKKEKKLSRAINLIGKFFTDHGLEPAEQQRVRKYVKEFIGERITNDELLEAERQGHYSSSPSGKGGSWFTHPPGCACGKCSEGG